MKTKGEGSHLHWSMHRMLVPQGNLQVLGEGVRGLILVKETEMTPCLVLGLGLIEQAEIVIRPMALCLASRSHRRITSQKLNIITTAPLINLNFLSVR